MPSGNKVSILPNFSVFQERSGICFWIFKFDAINFKFKHCGQTKLLMKDLADGLQIRNPAADPATSLLPGSHMVWDSSRYIIFFFFFNCNVLSGLCMIFFSFFSPHTKELRFLFYISYTLFFLIWYYTCFNAILPNHPPPHRVQKTILYICVSYNLF